MKAHNNFFLVIFVFLSTIQLYALEVVLEKTTSKGLESYKDFATKTEKATETIQKKAREFWEKGREEEDKDLIQQSSRAKTRGSNLERYLKDYNDQLKKLEDPQLSFQEKQEAENEINELKKDIISEKAQAETILETAAEKFGLTFEPTVAPKVEKKPEVMPKAVELSQDVLTAKQKEVEEIKNMKTDFEQQLKKAVNTADGQPLKNKIQAIDAYLKTLESSLKQYESLLKDYQGAIESWKPKFEVAAQKTIQRFDDAVREYKKEFGIPQPEPSAPKAEPEPVPTPKGFELSDKFLLKKENELVEVRKDEQALFEKIRITADPAFEKNYKTIQEYRKKLVAQLNTYQSLLKEYAEATPAERVRIENNAKKAIQQFDDLLQGYQAFKKTLEVEEFEIPKVEKLPEATNKDRQNLKDLTSLGVLSKLSDTRATRQLLQLNQLATDVITIASGRVRELDPTFDPEKIDTLFQKMKKAVKPLQRDPKAASAANAALENFRNKTLKDDFEIRVNPKKADALLKDELNVLNQDYQQIKKAIDALNKRLKGTSPLPADLSLKTFQEPKEQEVPGVGR